MGPRTSAGMPKGSISFKSQLVTVPTKRPMRMIHIPKAIDNSKGIALFIREVKSCDGMSNLYRMHFSWHSP